MTGTKIIEYHEIGVNDLKIVVDRVYNYAQRPSSTVPVDIENFSAALCDSQFETQDQNARVKPHDEWKEWWT